MTDSQCTNATMSHKFKTLILDETKVPKKALQSAFACVLFSYLTSGDSLMKLGSTSSLERSLPKLVVRRPHA